MSSKYNLLDNVFRVIFINDLLVVLIFNNKDELNEFINNRVSKYTCDTSSIKKVGVSLILQDSLVINAIKSEMNGRNS